MPTVRKAWSIKELILLMNLYCRLPIGRQHSRAPKVISLAKILERTSGSVSVKLNNFTSLDPEEAARGVVGLTGASQLDRKIWNEFHDDWETMAIESEDLWQSIVVSNEPLNAFKTSKKDIADPVAKDCAERFH